MANKVYLVEETKITFDNTVGANNTKFFPSGLADGSGYISDPRYLGAAPRSRLYRWRARSKNAGSVSPPATPSINGYIEIYWCNIEDDIPNYYDANMPSGAQILGNSNKKKNLQYIGSVEVDLASATEPFIKTGEARLTCDYGAVVWWNNTGGQLDTSNYHTFELTPIPDQIQ